jgi:signal transduction histidine kinase/ActR/RegA family two-component response regulator
MPVLSRLKRQIDRWAMVDSFTDERSRMQARFIATGSIAGGLAALLSTIILATQGSWLEGVQSAIGFTVCALSFTAFRLTRRSSVVSHLLGVVCSANYFFGTLVERDITYIVLFALVPLVTLFLSGRRVGAAWLLVAMVLSVVCWWDLRPASGEAARLFDAEMLRTFFLIPTVFLVGFVYDVGQQHLLRTVTAAREVAEAASREKSRFLAKVSHEIRTPLNGVLGTADLALLEEPSGRTREHFLTIQKSGSTLLALINDLLDVARAEAGKFELTPGPLLPAALVTDVVTLHRARASAEGLTVSAQVDVPTTLRLQGDAVRLRQVLGNLVSNAIKFTERGGVVVRCEGTKEGGDWRLRFTVTDTGPGISEEGQARLFVPFSQLTADAAGTGLGLAISRQVIEAMRGRLLLTSQVGVGSTFGFEVTLPSTEEVPEHTPVASRVAMEGRVLVVDDNAVNVKVAEGLLQRLGITTVSARDGVEALERLATERFDLVLMDLQMPLLDGLETTKRLRARGDTTPVLALTASAMPDDLAACRAAGMQDCLTKPLRLPLLIQAVLQHVPDVTERARLERISG